jgi:hypothetical protein
LIFFNVDLSSSSTWHVVWGSTFSWVITGVMPPKDSQMVPLWVIMCSLNRSNHCLIWNDGVPPDCII